MLTSRALSSVLYAHQAMESYSKAMRTVSGSDKFLAKELAAEGPRARAPALPDRLWCGVVWCAEGRGAVLGLCRGSGAVLEYRPRGSRPVWPSSRYCRCNTRPSYGFPVV